MADELEERDLQLAAAIRDACVEAVIEGFQMAAMRGLCHEGAVEAAVGEVKQLKPRQLLERAAAKRD